MNKKWVKRGDLSWRLSLGRDHSDTLSPRSGLARAGNPNKP